LLSRSPRFDGFFEGLSELGYVDGKTITIDYLSAAGENDRFPRLATDCLRRNADIIAVTTTPAARIAKNTTSAIPIVMVALGDPLATGLVDSLARPGGNLTGSSQMVSELAAKRLSILKDAVPGISRVLVPSYPPDPIAPVQVQALRAIAPSLDVTVQVQEIQSGKDLPAAFEAGATERADALLITAESIFVEHRAKVSELAAHYRLPAMYTYSIQVEDGGGLMAYDVNTTDLYRRAAAYVARILAGAKPTDLPVEQPTEFQLIINLKTAKALGLRLPPSFLARADRVIE